MMSSNDLLGFAPLVPMNRHMDRATRSDNSVARAARSALERLETRTLLADVPDGFTDGEVVGGLDSPAAMEIAPDGRIFVAGQKGHLWAVENGNATLVTTLDNVNSQDERGFLGLAFDPNFASNGFLYVYYTRNGNGGVHNRVSRLTISGNSSTAENTVIDLPDIEGAIFHMGGALHFGNDGRLYIAVGDYQDGSNSQNMNTLSGKILRINSNGSIPTDNPFFNSASGINRAIWALGLRNPFTFNFHPGTGQMFINDVGQEKWEEVNVGDAGANYGWPSSEGPDNVGSFTGPAYYYGRSEGIAIAGGVFYSAPNMSFPAQYHDKYFFADLGAGDIRVLDPNGFTKSDFASGLELPVDLDLGPDGSLYYLNRSREITGGHIGRISFAQVGAPSLISQPQNQSVAPGATATFSVQAGGEGPLSYQWQKNGADIDGANAATLTIQNVQAADAGQYRVIVSNNNGSVTSNNATLAVVSGNAPTAIIDAPAPGRRFRGGQTFTFRGRGTDTEDGTLGADRMTWQVDYHTGDIVRPFFPATSGVSEGTFTIPTETVFKASNVFYRVRLTVTDSGGISTTTTRDIQPIVSTVTIRSNVPGARVFLDGQTKEAPTSFNGVAGIERRISVPATQEIDGVTYVFDGWSDGGDRDHTVSTPLVDTSYVARWRARPERTTTKGLAQTIYNNRDRTGTLVTRNVKVVDFDWGEGSPHPLIHPDTFFARFRGKVQPEFTETYTFYAAADDGVRLFVNGQLLIDQWNDSSGDELSGTIDLQAGQKYDLRFDYFENGGPAKAQLLWSSPSTPKQVIPRAKLFSTIMPQTIAPTADAFVQGGGASGENFGDRSVLYTKTAADERYQRDAYMKFDISQLDVTNMGDAKLRVYGRMSSLSDTNVVIGLYEAPKAKWGERTISYDNRPVTLSKAVGTITVTHNENQWWEFDVGDFLRAQKEAGRSIVTLALRNLDPTSAFTILHSRNASSNGPQLVVSV
jgi:glucose/arabinose dehydrogenase